MQYLCKDERVEYQRVHDEFIFFGIFESENCRSQKVEKKDDRYLID
jgi:hypothetical protein